MDATLNRYLSPINPSAFPHLATVLLAIGTFFTAWFFVFEGNDFLSIAKYLQANWMFLFSSQKYQFHDREMARKKSFSKNWWSVYLLPYSSVSVLCFCCLQSVFMCKTFRFLRKTNTFFVLVTLSQSQC